MTKIRPARRITRSTNPKVGGASLGLLALLVGILLAGAALGCATTPRPRAAKPDAYHPLPGDRLAMLPERARFFCVRAEQGQRAQGVITAWVRQRERLAVGNPSAHLVYERCDGAASLQEISVAQRGDRVTVGLDSFEVSLPAPQGLKKRHLKLGFRRVLQKQRAARPERVAKR